MKCWHSLLNHVVVVRRLNCSQEALSRPAEETSLSSREVLGD